jgi:carboxymethylenebutenolidase
MANDIRERKKAGDFPPEVLKLFDSYVHGSMSRRDFLDKAARYAVGGFTAAAMLQSLRPNFAWAIQVPTDDKRIRADYVSYPSPQGSGTVRGYLVRNANAGGKRPAVVVIHENRGLNPYIEDVARRLALENYVAFAPDALSPVGGYPSGDEQKAAALFSKLDPAKRDQDLLAAKPFIQAHAEVNGAVGVVGFCFGGTTAINYAVRYPDLRAAVPFYGTPPTADDVPKIKAPLLLHYAEEDARLMKAWPSFEQALKANKIDYQGFVYAKAHHGFHNDTTPRYDEAAAKLAWSRTLAFFKEHLRA